MIPILRRAPLAALVAGVAALLATCGGPEPSRYSRKSAQASLSKLEAPGLVIGEFRVTKVTDGDTIRVDGLDSALRLLALDTEETFKSEKDRRLFENGWEEYLQTKRGASKHPTKAATPMGEEAHAWAKEFFRDAGRVRLERDNPKEIRDRFGRYLAYVFVEKNGTWVNYNVECVRAGMSPYFTKYGYSRRFHVEFVEAEREARAARRGIWDPTKMAYPDYDERKPWWNARAEFIAEFDRRDRGRDDHINLTDYDSVKRLEQAVGKEVTVLGTIGEIRLGDRGPTRVLLSRKMFGDFPIVFFDKDVFASTGIARWRGELVMVRGVVTVYENKRSKRKQLQIVVDRPGQVLLSEVPGLVVPGEAGRGGGRRRGRRHHRRGAGRPLIPSLQTLAPRSAMPTPRTLLTAAVAAAPLAVSLAGCGPGDDDVPAACADLVVGELVITEIFADYAAPPGGSGADDGNEWFEIKNVSGGAIDLAGLTIVHARPDGSRSRSHTMQSVTVPAGGYLVLGNVLPEFVTGHLGYGYGNDLGDLFNSNGGRITIRCGSNVIDEALYDAVRPGRSTGFDGAIPPDYQLNDDLARWCETPAEAAYEYAPNNYGTPGADNYACPGGGGMCDDDGTLRDPVAPQPGDLVITEVMPDPAAVADTAGEWFELYATADVDLNGLEIARVGGNPVIVSSSRCLHVPAGGYALLARNAETSANGGLPEVTATFNLGLSNSNSNVQISHGGVVLDTFAWTTVRAGKARQLDAAILDADGNDDPNVWCDATAAYGAGDLGTPGAANRSCGTTTAGMCLDPDTGAMRATVPPTALTLAITEWMPDPTAVGDAQGEWFEVRASAPLDLNGLQAGAGTLVAAPIVNTPMCVRLAAGDHAIFARTADPSTNGMLPAVHGTFGFSLANSNGSLRIGHGGVELHAVSWTGTAPAGRSIQIDADGMQCNAPAGTAAYNGTDVGTPAALNPSCTANVAMCTDPMTGQPRPVITPSVGQVEITEWMPDPTTVADTAGEWFEVQVSANVDLNGLQAGAASLGMTPIVGGAMCVPVPAGGHALFARTAAPGTNGNLPAVEGTFSFNLANSNGSLRIGFGGVEHHVVAWTGTAPAGRSIQRTGGNQCNAPAGTPVYNTVDNNNDHGTPKADAAVECP